MKAAGKIILGLIAGTVLGFIIVWILFPTTTESSGGALGKPIDSGWAIIMLNDRVTKTVFAYKFKGNRYQIIYDEDKMDTIKVAGAKDSIRLVPHMNSAGTIDKKFSYPVIKGEIVLFWFKKPKNL